MPVAQFDRTWVLATLGAHSRVCEVTTPGINNLALLFL